MKRSKKTVDPVFGVILTVALVIVLAAALTGFAFGVGDDVGEDFETGSADVLDGVSDGYISYWSVALPVILFGALFLNNRGE